MSSLEPRSPNRLSRKEREARAFRYLAVGSVSGAVAAIGFVVALVTEFSLGIPLLAGLIAVICLVLFRRTVGK